MPVLSAPPTRPIRRGLLLLIALLPMACGGEGGDASDAGGDAAATARDSEAAATADSEASSGALAPAGPPLTPEALASYLPAEIDGMPARGEDARLFPWAEQEDERNRPAESNVAYGGPTGPGARIMIYDLAGTPRLEAYRELFQAMLDGEAGLGTEEAEIERRSDGTIVITRPDASQFEPAVEYFIGGRFHAFLRPQRDGNDAAADARTAAQLAEVYAASPLPLLADGPEASPPQAAWLTDSAPAPAPVQVARELPPCDILLPTGEVARVCGVAGVEVVATDFEEEGRSCNRVYRPEAGGSGVVLLVTTFDDPSQAVGAVQIGATPGEYAVDHRDMNVGEGGFAQRDAGGDIPDRYALSFSSGPVLVEMNASDSPFDQPGQKMCLDLDALEGLARVVADNLSAAARN